MTEPIHIISLGAGVQSSTMALMAAAGEITPVPKCCIFADTQAEPASVYRWLDWLEKQLPFPVHRVTSGNLLKIQTTPSFSKDGFRYVRNLVPGFTYSINGGGILNRSCTRDFKIKPIQRKIREILATERRARAYQWIGISLDEALRMKPARVKYIVNIWPLVEKRMSRHDCVRWLEGHGYGLPPKSACIFCPFHNDAQWREVMADQGQREAVIKFEREWNWLIAQDTRSGQLKSKVFLHPSLRPISEVDFSTEEERGQLNLFNNECEGMCGV